MCDVGCWEGFCVGDTYIFKRKHLQTCRTEALNPEIPVFRVKYFQSQCRLSQTWVNRVSLYKF